MKIGIIHFCGVQIDKRHLFNNHLQIAQEENPEFFKCLNNAITGGIFSAYLLNNLEIKEYWDQIIKELKIFGANNEIIICIGENNSKHIPRCLGNSWFKKLKVFKSEWYSKFAIQRDYKRYFEMMESIFFKIE